MQNPELQKIITDKYRRTTDDTESIFIVLLWWYLSDCITYRELFLFLAAEKLHNVEPSWYQKRPALRDHNRKRIIYADFPSKQILSQGFIL